MHNMVEYIDTPINHLSWQVAAKTADETAPDCYGDTIIGGSQSSILIWQFLDASETYDQLPISEVASEHISTSACRVHLIGNIAFVALIDGTVILYEVVTERNNRKFLKIISETKNLHKGYRCNDMLFCAQTNSVLSCGNDGVISRFNIEHPKIVATKQVSDSSLKCMDLLTPNEVVCGTHNGCLQHFDLRTNSCVGTFIHHSLSMLTCIQRNPNVNHLVTGGNSEGSIIIYDLRNKDSALAQISAHVSAVTQVKYRPRNSNLLCSSSCDGELLKWNLNTEFTADKIPRKLESIGCVSDNFCINSFDVNHLGDLIYTTDHGALFYQKLNNVCP